MDSVVKGILQLISQHNVKKLVMGAASDKHYLGRMTGLWSEKAIFVDRRARDTCHIWFTCKGHLIYTREATMHGLITLSTPLSESQSISVVTRTNSVQGKEPGGFFNGQSGRVLDESLDTEKDERASSISSSSLLSCKLSYAGGSDVSLSQSEECEGTESAPGLSNGKEISNHSSCRSIPEDAVPEKVCDQIQKAMSEAHSSKREALEETLRRQEAEKEAFDAYRRAEEYKSAYYEELKRRKEAEIASANDKEEHEKIILLFVDHIEEYERTVKELQQKCDSTLEWLERVMIERDELEIERDIVGGEAEELRRRAEASASSTFCETVTENRPDPTAEVPEVLKPVRASSGGSSSFHQKAPSYFKCPIFLGVMRDPLVAADGYTYEAEAIRKWLKVGKHTSPLTNEVLSDIRLVPNLTLRSAIQEWLQRCGKTPRERIHSEMQTRKKFSLFLSEPH